MGRLAPRPLPGPLRPRLQVTGAKAAAAVTVGRELSSSPSSRLPCPCPIAAAHPPSCPTGVVESWKIFLILSWQKLEIIPISANQTGGSRL